MENYKKGKNIEEELTQDRIPIENLPEKLLWMHVKGGTKITNVVEYAEKAFNSGEYRSVVWSGSGGGVPKTISCSEVMKRNFEVHQVTRLAYQKWVDIKIAWTWFDFLLFSRVDEYWDPLLTGLDPIIVTRQIPAIHIFLSLDPLDTKTPGHQRPGMPTRFWPEPAAKQQKRDEDYIYKNKRNLNGNSGNRNNNNNRPQQNPKSKESPGQKGPANRKNQNTTRSSKPSQPQPGTSAQSEETATSWD